MDSDLESGEIESAVESEGEQDFAAGPNDDFSNLKVKFNRFNEEEDVEDDNEGVPDYEEEKSVERMEVSEEERARKMAELIDEVSKLEEQERKTEEERKREEAENDITKRGANFKMGKVEMRNCGPVLCSDTMSSSMHFSGSYANYPRGAVGTVKDTAMNYMKIASLYKRNGKTQTFPKDKKNDHPVEFEYFNVNGQTPKKETAINDILRLRSLMAITEPMELVSETVDILNRNANCLGEGNSSICVFCGCSHERNLALSCHIRLCENITELPWDVLTTGDCYEMTFNMFAKVFAFDKIKPDGTFGYLHWADLAQELEGDLKWLRTRTIKETTFYQGIKRRTPKCRPDLVNMDRREFVGQCCSSKMVTKDEKRSEEQRCIACFAFMVMLFQVPTELISGTRCTCKNNAGTLKNEEAAALTEEIIESGEEAISSSSELKGCFITSDCKKYNNSVNLIELAIHTVLKCINCSLEVTLIALFSHAFFGAIRTVQAPKMPIRKDGIIITKSLLEIGKKVLDNFKTINAVKFLEDYHTILPTRKPGQLPELKDTYLPFFLHEDALWMVIIFQTHRLSESSTLMLDLGRRMGMGVFNLTATSSQEFRITKNHEIISSALAAIGAQVNDEISDGQLDRIIGRLINDYHNPKKHELVKAYMEMGLEKVKNLGQFGKHQLWYIGKSDDGFQIAIYPKTYSSQINVDICTYSMEASNRVLSEKKSVATFSGDGNLYSSPIVVGRVHSVPNKYFNGFYPAGKNPITDEENLSAMVCSSSRDQIPSSVTLVHTLHGIGAYQGVWKNEFTSKRMSKEGESLSKRMDDLGLGPNIRPMILNGNCVATLDFCFATQLQVRFALAGNKDVCSRLFDLKAADPTVNKENFRGTIDTEVTSLYKMLGSFEADAREPRRAALGAPLTPEARSKLRSVINDISTREKGHSSIGETLLKMASVVKSEKMKQLLSRFGFGTTTPGITETGRKVWEELNSKLYTIAKNDPIKRKRTAQDWEKEKAENYKRYRAERDFKFGGL